ncbi:MAG: DUF1269 domain-containing protein [Chloroflexota bacterium]
MEPVELILAVYPDPQRAPEVLKRLRLQQAERKLKVFDAAAVCRDARGTTSVSDEGDLDARRGSLFGAIVGGLIGLLGGPAGMVVGAAAGAATGGLVAHSTDLGFDQKMVNQVKETVQPGTSVMLVLVERPWAESVAQFLDQAEARVFRGLLKDDLVKRLQSND